MVLFWIFAGLTVLGLIAYGLQILSLRSYASCPAHTEGEDASPQFLPPVSILKPLKGLDDNLLDNLESFCLQDYPQYEVIFSLQDFNDPAYRVARRVKEKYPEKEITILVERCTAGLNPKVNNLIPACKAARYPTILISDSNVMVERDYLKEIVRHLGDSEVGLVSNVIKGVRAKSIGSIMENLHLNSFVAGSVCVLDKFLGMPCVVGKSMLMRKTDLEAIGGFRGVKDVLAEDYIIGKKMQKRGKKVILSNHLISNVNEYWGVRKFVNRHTRWAKLRWRIGGIRYLSELITNAVFMSCLPMVLTGPSHATVSLAFLVSTLKILGDLHMGRRMGSEMNPFLYLLSPVKDLVIGVIWFVPLLSNTVAWRGNRYVIAKDSLLLPCPESGIWALRYRVTEAIKARFA